MILKVKSLSLAGIIIVFCSFTTVAEGNSIWQSIGYYLYKPIAFCLPHYEQRKVMLNKETQYFNINVEEDESGRRHLVFLPRRGSQSVFDPNNKDQVFSKYIKYSLLAFAVENKKPEKILFVGLGGGIMPMVVRKLFPDVEIDIVEIDPAIPNIAEKYFGFRPDSKIHIFIKDGRNYVNRCKTTYDAVFIDVYNAYNIPFQFTTKEFYMQIKRIMNDKAICAVNVANMGKADFIADELLTIKDIFPSAFIFATEGNTNYIPVIVNSTEITYKGFTNKVISCRNSSFFMGSRQSLLSRRLNDQQVDKITGDGIVITDDYTPIY